MKYNDYRIFKSDEEVQDFLETYYVNAMNQLSVNDAALLFSENISLVKEESYLYDIVKNSFQSAIRKVPVVPFNLVLFCMNSEESDNHSRPFLPHFFFKRDTLNRKNYLKVYVPKGSMILPICGIHSASDFGNLGVILDSRFLKELNGNEFVYLNTKDYNNPHDCEKIATMSNRKRRLTTTYEELKISQEYTHHFATKESLLSNPSDPDYRILQPLYEESEKIARLLDIDEFDLSYANELQRDEYTPLDAVLFTKKDFQTLKRPLLMFDVHILFQRKEVVIATLAHELRHLYQEMHPDELKQTFSAYGFEESIFDMREVDADGFALYYLMQDFKIPVEEAANYVCPEMKQYFLVAYWIREERAKAFEKNYNKKNIQL